VAVIGAMVGIAVLTFVLPFAARFFNFDLPVGLFFESFLVGVGGAVAVEVLYRVTGARAPERQTDTH
jgi:cation-transporting ATPase E